MVIDYCCTHGNLEHDNFECYTIVFLLVSTFEFFQAGCTTVLSLLEIKKQGKILPSFTCRSLLTLIRRTVKLGICWEGEMSLIDVLVSTTKSLKRLVILLAACLAYILNLAQGPIDHNIIMNVDVIMGSAIRHFIVAAQEVVAL